MRKTRASGRPRGSLVIPGDERDSPGSQRERTEGKGGACPSTQAGLQPDAAFPLL